MSPNVVVFCTDQQRWDTTGLHGNPLDLTPNFDRLARDGTHLRHTFAVNPLCGPSRASFQTGCYPTAVDLHRNGLALADDVTTLARVFRAAGYRTSYIGKWHLAGDPHVGPVPANRRGGYEDWLASNILEFTSDAYRTTLYDADEQPVDLPGYRVDALCDAAIRHLHQHRDEQQFLFVSFVEPHHQNSRDDYPAPVGYRQRYEGRWMPPDLAALGGSSHQMIAGYWGMVRRLDEALGRLCDALISLGMSENTIVMFASDHGNHFKTRNAEYKRSGHEASIRIPSAIWGPGFDLGADVRQLVTTADLGPTLIDAAGLAVPEQMQGRSILPLLRGDDVKWPDEVLVQISESHVGRALRTPRWKYGVTARPDEPSDADRRRRIVTTDAAAASSYVDAYLYDLESDPHELNNLVDSASHQHLLEQLSTRMADRMVDVGEQQPTIHRRSGVVDRRLDPPDGLDAKR